MSNFLQTLIYGAQPEPTPLPPRRTYTRAQERQAKAAGFPSAEAAILWQEQQRVGSKVQGGGIKKHDLASGIKAAGMIHPANILSAILGKWQGAMGQ